MTSRHRKKKNKWLTAVVANSRGDIFDLAGYGAVGNDGPIDIPLTGRHTLNLPYGSELMYLPNRIPLLYNIRKNRIEPVAENPYEPGEPIFPVAAFNSPGYVITHTCTYEERPSAGYLPLFSYGAVGWQQDHFRSAIIQVDKEPRQDLSRMPLEKIHSGIEKMRKRIPSNRLRVHLEGCALTYGCPAGKNFFLGRYEAPLPTSKTCNARCLGCISLQPQTGIPSSQNRIVFTPTPEEICEVALAHILKVPRAVVSFGQGCEGDPLMAADTIRRAISLIRGRTDQGTINMNTNGSLPGKIESLIDAGLDSLRISMNSVRKECYRAYFRPMGYRFEDVLSTIDLALSRNVHVAVNYLNCPGFTDGPEEYRALLDFLQLHPIHMIQWRNLNFDPLRYRQIMSKVISNTDHASHSNKTDSIAQESPIGMVELLQRVRRAFPRLMYGYFNPPREKYSRNVL